MTMLRFMWQCCGWMIDPKLWGIDWLYRKLFRKDPEKEFERLVLRGFVKGRHGWNRPRMLRSCYVHGVVSREAVQEILDKGR